MADRLWNIRRELGKNNLTRYSWLGWSAPNLGEAEVLKLWDIVEIGLGGYVIGRSAEKVLPGIVQSLNKS